MADFDFGNLLYVLALILFAVFGSRKKKKPLQTVPPDYTHEQEENNDPGFFEKILSDEKYFSQPEEGVVQEESGYDQVFQEENEIEKKEAIYKNPKFDIKPQEYSQPDNQYKHFDYSTDTITLTTHEKLNEILGGPFDLRRAVIYSEILNRKSF
ncbi:MAG: hypothetical protein U9R19_08100 [Bacteroidota bacterium]|nr:hypothetical protein [Bacteroidota bacterium]